MKPKWSFDGEIYRRANEAIAHGALTNSKRAQSFIKGVYPTHLKRGQECYVWDTNKNRYIDFICGLGANLLGYANEEINAAIERRLRSGITLSLGTEIEVEAAERVKECFPFVDRVRFLKTGSEACSAAIRIARAYTGKDWILSEGYHGWHDSFVSLTFPASGILTEQRIMKLGDVDEPLPSQVAAIIIEPIMTDISPERIERLRELRKRCNEWGTLLIFDEVITGFRFPALSVAKEYGITPDLICIGKAMGGGLPLAAVGGKAEIMEADYFVSSTFAGETLSLAAFLKTTDLLQNKYKLDYLWDKGSQFLSRFNQMWPEVITLEGYPTRSILLGEPKTKALFMQECCKAGILLGPSLFFNFPHIDVMEESLSVFQDVIRRIRAGVVELEGEMPVQPFAQKVRAS